VISAAKCRQRATEAVQLARLAQTKDQKNALYGMARAWQTLAKHAEQ
jgi:hypothetical protein